LQQMKKIIFTTVIVSESGGHTRRRNSEFLNWRLKNS
jgi:hypothetical protein